MNLQLIAVNGSLYSSQYAKTNGTVLTFPVNGPQPAQYPNASSAAQLDPTNRLTMTRYVRINASAANCLHFREIMVFDSTYTNVAMMKPVSSSPQAVGYSASMAVNGIIDFDNATAGDMTNSLACDGTGWWQVDLGGLYSIAQILIWNRYPQTVPATTGQALGAKLTNASLYLLNWNGDVIGNALINGAQMIPSLVVPTYLPSPSRTATATQTPTQTSSQTSTPSPSSTLSTGASISSTLTPTMTPLSPYPNAVRLTSSGTGQSLNFVELMVFDVNQRLMSASIAGATLSLTSAYATQYGAFNGGDMLADPLAQSGAASQFVNSGGSTTFDAYTATFPLSLPSPVSYAVFVNRVDSCCYNRVLQYKSAIQLVAVNGTIWQKPITTNGSVSTYYFAPLTAAPTPSPTDPLQTSIANRLSGVRFIRVNASAGNCLMFREIFAFDTTYTNVALLKTTTSSAYNGTFSPSSAVNGQIEFDNITAGDMFLSQKCDGTAWWQVDLGAVYNLTSLMIWNRYPWVVANTTIGQLIGAKLAGAKLLLLNYNGDPVGNFTLNGNMVQTINVVTYAPSPSMTPSTTLSPSLGTTPSNTATVTYSPTSTRTPTSTQTSTSTPLSVFPNKLIFGISGANSFNFMEIFAFSNTGQNVAASILGASASMSSVYSATAYQAFYGNDLNADPFVYGGTGSNQFPNSGNPATGSNWTVQFAPQPGYAAGYPVPISTVYFVNRLDCCNTRAVAAGGWIALVSPNGTQYAKQYFADKADWGALASGTVATFRFNDLQTQPVYPNPSSPFQQSLSNQNNLVRYVKITSAVQTCLYFRELFVLDVTMTNVALFKPTTSSLSSYTDPASGVTSLPSFGNDGIIDMDNATAGNMANYPCDGSGWWQVDLGGVYNLSKLVFWNRFPWTSPTTVGQQMGANAAGAQVSYFNAFGVPVGSTILNGNMIQTINVVLSPPTPSITPSPSTTGSPSTSASPSGTPPSTPSMTPSTSATLTIGGVPSDTASASVTPTGTPPGTPPPTPTRSVTASPLSRLPYRAVLQTNGGSAAGGGAWGCLNFAELFVFSPSMQLLSAPQLGASAVSTTTYQSLFFQYGPQFGNDMIVDYSAAETGLYRSACSPNGDTWTMTLSTPSPVAFAYFMNRFTVNGATNNQAITNGSGTLTIYGQAGNAVSYASLLSATVTTVASAIYGGGGVTSSGGGFVSPVSQPIYPPANDPWQASFAAQTSAVRYINMTNVPGQCMNFREIFVFDTTWTNVAYLKPATSTMQYTSANVAFYASMGVDGIIDFDAGNGNLVASLNCVNEWWAVDLGAMYNVTRIVFFNRNGYATRSNGATVSFLNAFGSQVGVLTLNSSLVQTLDVTLFAPSASPTATTSATSTATMSKSLSSTRTSSPTLSPTASLTGSNTGSLSTTPSTSPSASWTPSGTGSSSASLSAGGTPSSTLTNTPTMTASASLTASASCSLSLSSTVTGSNTASSSSSPSVTPTPSPLSPYPYALRVTSSGSGQSLNFIELFVFDQFNRNLGYRLVSTISMSTTLSSSQVCPSGGTGYCAACGADMNADPIVNGIGGSAACLVNSAGSLTLDYYQVLFPPGPGYPGGMPTPLSSAVFVNRLDCCNNRVLQFHSTVQALNYNGTTTVMPFTSNGTVSTFAFQAPQPAPTPSPSDPLQVSPTNRLLNVRYVRLQAAPANYLHFREVYVFDTTYTNVAALKNVTSSAQYSALYPNTAGVDTIIEFDNPSSGNMFHSSASDGSGWWQVDLGAVFNLTKIIVWNRYPYTNPTTTGSTLGTRMNGATVKFLNYYGDTIGTATLNGNMVQTINVATFPPTQSATPTSSASATSSASNSFGITPSPTMSVTPSPSVTPSSLSRYPSNVHVYTYGAAGKQCLNFEELFVFDVNGRDVGATAAGAVTSLTSTYGTNYASYGGDLLADAYANELTQAFVNAGCSALSDYYQVTFAPTRISTIYFVNRVSNGLNQRIVASSGQVQLFSPAGGAFAVATLPITSNQTITTFTLSAPAPVSLPDPSDPSQTSGANQAQFVRSVRIDAAPGNCLTFREIFVFDTTYANVALLKSTTSSSLASGSSSAMAVDAVIDFDNTASGSNLFASSSCSGAGWWQVDLGAIYNISTVVVFNNFPLTFGNSSLGASMGAALSGATLSFLNQGGAVVGLQVLSGGMIQTYAVPTFAPTPTSTSTSSPTMSITTSITASFTSSITATPSASITFGISPSVTASVTASPSPSATVTPTITATPTATSSPLSPNPVRARIMTNGTSQCLSFAELFVFDKFGRDVAAIAAGASASMSSGTSAGAGGDLIADPLGGAGAVASAACTAMSDYYEVVFPPAPGYPGGLPSVVSRAYFVNRVDSGLATKITASSGAMQFFAPNGSQVASGALTAATVTTLSFGAAPVPPVPSSSDPLQADPVAQAQYARFVRINAAPGSCLFFRELFVMDTTYTNVALNKVTSSSGQYTLDPVIYSSANGVNGIIAMDGVSGATVGDLTFMAQCDGTAWWMVDLGAIYNISRIVLFNRFPLTTPVSNGASLGAQMNGATLSLLNAFGAPIGLQTLSGSMVQSFVVPTFAPSTSATASSTATRSPTNSRSSTQTPTSTRSSTAATTKSSTGSPSPTLTPTSSSSASASSSVTQSHSAAATQSRTAATTRTPAATQTPAASNTATQTPSSSNTASPSNTQATTRTASPSNSPSSSPSATTSESSSYSAKPTQSSSAARTHTPTRSGTPSSSQTRTSTATSSPAATVTSSPSATSAETSSPSRSPIATGTPAVTTTPAATRSPTQTPSKPGTPAATSTRTPTATTTPTKTPTASKTASKTGTPTKTGSKTRTASPTPSKTPTKSMTPTHTPSSTKKAK